MVKISWACFLISVPLARQAEVAQMLPQFLTKRSELINWIDTISKTDDMSNPLLIPRVINIIKEARKQAQIKTSSGTNISAKKGIKLSIEQMTHDNIRNFISKEDGGSLYRLIKNMEKVIESKIEQEEKSKLDINLNTPQKIGSSIGGF